MAVTLSAFLCEPLVSLKCTVTVRLVESELRETGSNFQFDEHD